MENNDLERAIQIWFDMKYELYSRLDRYDSIYLYYEGEIYADIRIKKETKIIYHKLSFRDEFFEIFPVELSDFKQHMTKWVEDTFGLNGFTPIHGTADGFPLLKIPLV